MGSRCEFHQSDALNSVLAPFTAGLSAPVLGVAGAVIGGVGAGIKGTFLFNEKSKKILEVCD